MYIYIQTLRKNEMQYNGSFKRNLIGLHSEFSFS